MRQEFSFKVNGTTLSFVRLWHDCWICSLPHMVAEDLRFATTPLDMITVNELDFNTRATNCMVSENIKTVADLVKLNKELLKLPNLSKGTYMHIIHTLDEYGLKDAAKTLLTALQEKKK
jgi:DNA-directed RNA polymerase alpha subunit